MTPSDDYLFDPRPPLERDPEFSVRPRHDGPGLTDSDHDRLSTSLGRVFDLMQDGQWRTHEEIANATGDAQGGVSARLRDFRKEKFARIYPVAAVHKRRRTPGLYEYRVEVH